MSETLIVFMSRFRRSLAFWTLAPVVASTLIAALASGAFIYFALSEFGERQASNDLHWRALSIFRIVDSNLDELQRGGKINDSSALRQRKVNALTEIEDFARVNGLMVTVQDKREPTLPTIELGVLIKRQEASALSSLIDRFLLSQSQIRTRTIQFEPWQWEIKLVQDDRAYQSLINDLLLDGGLGAVLFVAGISGIMLYLTNLTRKPIRSIINDLTNNRTPRYEGIDEFEYLSQSIASMMNAIREQSRQLETQVDELANAKAIAESANQAKSTFLANISHELRSPLTAILGFARLLQREKDLQPAVKDRIAIIVKSSEHLYTLINQVLDLSKIEAGRTTLSVTSFDLYNLVDELADMFTNVAKQKDLLMIVDRGLEVPQYISADEVKLRQVLINLLSNALKFTKAGAVTLRIRVDAPANQENDLGACVLWFMAIDTGCGIAPDELDRLGEAFVQAQGGQHAQEGTGLGLAISRNFVKLMGGEFSITSQLNKGTTCEFKISVKRAAADSVRTDVRKVAPRILALAPDQPKYRLLVTEDRPDSRKLLVQLLTPLGFEVREASNGQEAIEIWETWKPHLIWMDMRMPVMDGWETTRRIKATAKGKSTIVIAVTASSFEEDREQILAAGCDDFLRKPFHESALLHMMRKHLGVQFIYDEAPSSPAVSPPDLESMKALPADLRAQFLEAVMRLDIDAIEATIEKIRAYDEACAKALDALAQGFEYTRMLALLNEVNQAS